MTEEQLPNENLEDNLPMVNYIMMHRIYDLLTIRGYTISEDQAKRIVNKLSPALAELDSEYLKKNFEAISGEIQREVVAKSTVTASVLDSVAAPVTASVFESVVAPVTARAPAMVALPELASVVNEPAAAVVPPMAVPLMVPPVIVTLFASCVAIVPRPRFVRAPDAVVAPVPPLAIGSVPVTSVVRDT